MPGCNKALAFGRLKGLTERIGLAGAGVGSLLNSAAKPCRTRAVCPAQVLFAQRAAGRATRGPTAAKRAACAWTLGLIAAAGLLLQVACTGTTSPAFARPHASKIPSHFLLQLAHVKLKPTLGRRWLPSRPPSAPLPLPFGALPRPRGCPGCACGAYPSTPRRGTWRASSGASAWRRGATAAMPWSCCVATGAGPRARPSPTSRTWWKP